MARVRSTLAHNYARAIATALDVEQASGQRYLVMIVAAALICSTLFWSVIGWLYPDLTGKRTGLGWAHTVGPFVVIPLLFAYVDISTSIADTLIDVESERSFMHIGNAIGIGIGFFGAHILRARRSRR